MLPHPTTSSFVSTMACLALSAAWRARIVFADPSMLERLDAHLAEPRESLAELAPFGFAQRRSSRADRVALDDAEFFERGLQAGNCRAMRCAAALERRRDAKFLDRLLI